MITQSRLAEHLFWIRERLDGMDTSLQSAVAQFHLLVMELLEDGGVSELAMRRIQNLTHMLPFTDAARKEMFREVEKRGDRYHKDPPL